MMNFEWFILDELKQVRGPYRLAELHRLLERCDLLVWREGLSDWKLVSSIHELGLPVPNLRSYQLVVANRSEESKAGKPGSGRWFARQNFEKLCDELIGICRGLIADARLNDEEIRYLKGWLAEHSELAENWPASAIARRLEICLADGVISDPERAEMIELLQRVTGHIPEPTESTRLATRLPIDEPPPEVVFAGRHFCFTGKFIYGSRSICEEAVIRRGGQCQKQPNHCTDYLVIGTVASRDWVHSTYGRKIEDAMFLKENGGKVRIISEEHWTRFVVES